MKRLLLFLLSATLATALAVEDRTYSDCCHDTNGADGCISQVYFLDIPTHDLNPFGPDGFRSQECSPVKTQQFYAGDWTITMVNQDSDASCSLTIAISYDCSGEVECEKSLAYKLDEGQSMTFASYFHGAPVNIMVTGANANMKSTAQCQITIRAEFPGGMDWKTPVENIGIACGAVTGVYGVWKLGRKYGPQKCRSRSATAATETKPLLG